MQELKTNTYTLKYSQKAGTMDTRATYNQACVYLRSKYIIPNGYC